MRIHGILFENGVVGGIHAGSSEGAKRFCEECEIDVLHGRIYSFLIQRKKYALENGYLQRSIKGYKQGKKRKTPVYHYKLTAKAIEELGPLFKNGIPERLKEYV